MFRLVPALLISINIPLITTYGFAFCLSDNHFVPAKASLPIPVTEDGIVILDNDVHPENVSFSISITEDGIVISVNDVHPENAAYPISVTEDGNFTVFTFSFSLNASYIATTSFPPSFSGTTTFSSVPLYASIDTPVES